VITCVYLGVGECRRHSNTSSSSLLGSNGNDLSMFVSASSTFDWHLSFEARCLTWREHCRKGSSS